MKEATLQVRMDADLKEQAEELYKKLGTSFAEAVRIFAKQSVRENAMPFRIGIGRNVLLQYKLGKMEEEEDMIDYDFKF